MEYPEHTQDEINEAWDNHIDRLIDDGKDEV